MKRVISLPLFLVFFYTSFIQAARVYEKDAALVAKNFFYERISQYQSLTYSDLVILPAIKIEYQGQLVYYVFNVKPEGFIVVSAWNVEPLLTLAWDQGIPLYSAGWSVPNINRHAFVYNGYQDSAYYHFNWGWSGSLDGYFYTDNLTPEGSNFNLAQELIINAVPDPVTSPSGKMFMVFITNDTGRAPGWTAYYETDLVGLYDAVEMAGQIKIYPNPSNGCFYLDYKGQHEGSIILEVKDIFGRPVYKETLTRSQSNHLLELNHLSPGLYYLILLGEIPDNISRKIIIQ
jgi:hypothetical protein